jgi:hypothetical protein
MAPKEIGCNGMDQIHVGQDRVQLKLGGKRQIIQKSRFVISKVMVVIRLYSQGDSYICTTYQKDISITYT